MQFLHRMFLSGPRFCSYLGYGLLENWDSRRCSGFVFYLFESGRILAVVNGLAMSCAFL
jgi:hypothetical protein